MVCTQLSAAYHRALQNHRPVNGWELMRWLCHDCKRIDECPSQPVQLDEDLPGDTLRSARADSAGDSDTDSRRAGS